MFKRRAKIVATLGPAADSPKILERMIEAGLDCARLNLSHGTLAEHYRRVQMVRRLSRKHQRPVAVLFDLQGPKIRTGLLEKGKPVYLFRGKSITITTKELPGNAAWVSTTYKHLPLDVQKGDPILLDDGKIQLRVEKRGPRSVVCRILHGGWLKEHAGMNLPGTHLSSPALTKKDLEDLKMGLKWGIDAVALSFVRKAADVYQLKEILRRHRVRIPVIAKIERAEGLEHLEEILEAAEGVMVARGDLGVEVSLEKVPVLQKHIIHRANEKGVFVITATQMLESMVEDPTPTRAEASDVANAILDGTDAVMLSGETARGKHPIEVIQMMSRIILEAEASAKPKVVLDHTHHEASMVHAVVHAACQAAEEVGAKAILVFSQTGTTVRLTSKLKPVKPIIGIAPTPEVCRQMSLYWGTDPIVSLFGKTTDEMIILGERKVVRDKLLHRGDKVVVVSGSQHLRGATNMMKILTL